MSTTKVKPNHTPYLQKEKLKRNTKIPLVAMFKNVETRSDFVAVFFHFSKSFNEHMLDFFLNDTNRQKINTYWPLVAT